LTAVPLGVGDAQRFAGLVEQVHREDAERREPGDEPRNAGEQLIEVEHAGHFAAEREKRGQTVLIGRTCPGGNRRRRFAGRGIGRGH
jgi:demethoxyubiquinone hydroxylase (CLK1/Coq7/Cat5 family)